MTEKARHPPGENAEERTPPDGPDRWAPTPYGPERAAFAPSPRPPLLQRVAPVTTNLKVYRQRYLRPDLVAGVTVAALAIPSGMAYAEVAGLSPVPGLYALLPAVAYALFGSSRQLVVGPEAALALLVGSVVAPMADGDPGRYAIRAGRAGATGCCDRRHGRLRHHRTR